MSNVESNGVWPHTDLDLNTSASLPECPVTEGIDVDSGTGVGKDALAKGFISDANNFDPQPNPAGSDQADGSETPATVDPRGSPLNGFLGRATLLVER